jgi:hypothetical protein
LKKTEFDGLGTICAISYSETHDDGASLEMEKNLIGMAKGVISALGLIILCQVYMIF